MYGVEQAREDLTVVVLYSMYAVRMVYLYRELQLRREMQEAEHDPLTGLVNRRGLERRVEASWKSSFNRQETVAAFVIDIDFRCRLFRLC